MTVQCKMSVDRRNILEALKQQKSKTICAHSDSCEWSGYQRGNEHKLQLHDAS